jgi:broad specificity phosphatase PhoE
VAFLAVPQRPFAPGGESWSSFRTRVQGTTLRLAEGFAGKTVLAVCHAGFIVVTMIALLDILRPDSQTYLVSG